LNSWEITENSCGYQVNYIRLLSKFVTADLDCQGIPNGTAFFDTCGICAGGLTNRDPDTLICNCSAYLYKNKTDTLACLSYTSPSGRYIWDKPGTYSDTITGYNGCDSVIIIKLDFIQVNTSITISGDTLIADNNEAGYRWLDCKENYSIIYNENSKYFTPIKSGEYAVEITQNGCKDTSLCFMIEVTGISRQKKLNGLNVYPNPSNGLFKVDISAGNIEFLRAEIKNVLGKTIHYEEFADMRSITMSIHESPGIYYLFIKNNHDEQRVIKILIY